MRKAILLAMAAAIVAMFAMPGTASANWTRHHQNNNSNGELEITGTDVFFETSLGGVTCASTISKVLFEGGTTGKVNSLEPEATVTSQCQGRGAINQCDVHEAKGDNFPWTIHTATGTTVTITSGTVTNTLTGFFCPHTLSMTPGTVTMTVAAGEVNTTSTMTMSGNLLTDGDLGNGIATTVSATAHVLGTITYGI